MVVVLGAIAVVALVAQVVDSPEPSPDRVEQPAKSQTYLSYTTFDAIRKLNPMTVEAQLLEQASPLDYRAWEQGHLKVEDSPERGTGLVGDFNRDGRKDRALPLTRDGVCYLVVASLEQGEWRLPGHCITGLREKELRDPKRLRSLAEDACVLDDEERAEMVWSFWARDFKAGQAALRNGKYDSAERWLLSALREARQVKGVSREGRVAETLRELGTLYRQIGDTQRSLASFKEALDLLEDGSRNPEGERSKALEQACSDLASVHLEKNEGEQAVKFFRRALELHEQNRCGYSADVTELELRLGLVRGYRLCGRLREADVSINQADKLLRRAYFAPGQHWDIPAYALQVAVEYRHLGDSRRAADTCRYGLDSWDRLEGAPSDIRTQLEAELDSLSRGLE